MRQHSQRQMHHIIHAPAYLQLKVGKGPVDKQLLKKISNAAQQWQYRDKNYLSNVTEELERSVKAARSSGKTSAHSKDEIIAKVMDLKANGSLMQYEAISELANIVLEFADNLDTLDDKVLRLVYSLTQIVQMILSGRIDNDDTPARQAFAREITKVCKKYNERYR